MATVYCWKPGTRIAGIEAQVAGVRLEKIRKRHKGELKSEYVVRDARSERSPLHPVFDWDDAGAADKWRIEQAKMLIRSVAVVVNVRENDEPHVMRAFVSVKHDGAPSYTSLSVALADDDMRGQVLANARRELEQWRRRYQEYTELAEVFAAVDAHLEKIAA